MAAQKIVDGVYVIPLGGVNAFLLEAQDELVLIDTGSPGNADEILLAVNELGKQPKKSGKGMWILIAIVAIVALPEIIAITLHVIKWRPESTTNRGELVVPARLISDLALAAHEGAQKCDPIAQVGAVEVFVHQAA